MLRMVDLLRSREMAWGVLRVKIVEFRSGPQPEVGVFSPGGNLQSVKENLYRCGGSARAERSSILQFRAEVTQMALAPIVAAASRSGP
jgi:hypothetical protein